MRSSVFYRTTRRAAAFLAAALLAAPTAADVRLKDIVTVEGVRDNQLIGYGLVVGLDGTGDTARGSPFTAQSIDGMLERLGVGNLDPDAIETRNTAAVMVTAKLPPFARRGSEIDVAISSLGNATSLRGGTLVVTPLSGADGEIYAVAQGPLAASGYKAAGNAASVTEGVPTSARIENGAIVEREIDFDLEALERIRLALRTPDFTTASRIADAIETSGLGASAHLRDPGTVEVTPGPGTDIAPLMARLETLRVTPDAIARVVVDAKTGTIVMGADVRISEVAISQGGMTVMVDESFQTSQPAPFSIGETVVTPSTDIEVTPRDSGFAVLEGDVSLRALVDGLNAIGIGARETISILQAIKAAGALHADLELL
mgnify:CR=1 FL=1